jgi:hypothetical protein
MIGKGMPPHAFSSLALGASGILDLDYLCLFFAFFSQSCFTVQRFILHWFFAGSAP